LIHPLALVHADCEIGEGTRVWQFASVLRGARIGKHSSVGACSVVDGSRLGDRARIGHGAQVHPGVVSGSDLFLGPGAILCNDPWPWLDNQDFDLEALIEGRSVAVVCEDRVTIGAGAIILPGVRLGAGSVVGAGVIVRRDVPAGQINLGGEMRPVKGGPRRGPARMRLVA
jgi:UDP-2-acetamido-3-amino-2,3-dideoxy-glucuronate N-acetyltransferase